MDLGKKTLGISLFAFVAVLFFFEFTNTDLIIQQYFYLPAQKGWILEDPHLLYHAIFYKGIKIPIYIIGVSALLASIISWKKNIWHSYRKGLLVVTLSLILLPTLIAVVGKKISNVQCPNDLTIFSGTIPYVKLFTAYPLNPNSLNGKWPEGHCWPAGHASGGFALISLVVLFRTRRNKIFAFIFAMSLGWIMGLYQIFRGAHFLSHHLVTMILAFILISTLNIFIKDFSHESSPIKK